MEDLTLDSPDRPESCYVSLQERDTERRETWMITKTKVGGDLEPRDLGDL